MELTCDMMELFLSVVDSLKKSIDMDSDSFNERKMTQAVNKLNEGGFTKNDQGGEWPIHISKAFFNALIVCIHLFIFIFLFCEYMCILEKRKRTNTLDYL